MLKTKTPNTYGITERQPTLLEDQLIKFEMGDMTKEEAKQFIERFKRADNKLGLKLLVDFEEVYA